MRTHFSHLLLPDQNYEKKLNLTPPPRTGPSQHIGLSHNFYKIQIKSFLFLFFLCVHLLLSPWFMRRIMSFDHLLSCTFAPFHYCSMPVAVPGPVAVPLPRRSVAPSPCPGPTPLFLDVEPQALLRFACKESNNVLRFNMSDS